MTARVDDAAALLAEGFAQQVRRWAAAAGADATAAALAAAAARRLSQAASDGHVSVALAEIAAACTPPVAAAALGEALRASGVAGPADAPGGRPMVLDGHGRLYLHRAFDDERRLARRLAQAAALPPLPLAEDTRGLIDELFGAGAGRADDQKLAVAMALRGRLLLVSGGPGTGKTTTVVNLLAALLKQQPGCRIALAAPTGKAAAALAQALRERSGHLSPALRAALPQDATTVHRLLGARGSGRFAFSAAQPLPIDALVVDEASMLDLALATRLLGSVPAHARIVLLGDKDQLAAVEAGAVFAELCAERRLSPAAAGELAAATGVAAERLAPLVASADAAVPDCVVWLRENFRFDAASPLGRLADAVNRGAGDAALAVLQSAADASLQWLPDGAARPAPESGQALQQGFEPYLAAVRRNPGDVAAASAAFGAFRVLCAVREGPRGALALNEALSRHARGALGPAFDADPASHWFVGRPVMVLANDPLQRLFNGDIGLALPDAGGALAVWFPDGPERWRALPPLALPAHQSAWAMTVHKAQGSEFGHAAVLLPVQRSRVLTRELLYTALTRARRAVTLIGSAEAVRAAVAAPTRRASGLVDALRAAALC
jgi:exodeoxyribonuclease V alpha subunit